MTARLPSRIRPQLILLRLCAALVLAAIGLQAAGPVSAPLEARHGSAFSATTYEVAIPPQRRVETAQVEQAIPPLLPARAEQIFHPAPAVSSDRVQPRPDSTGPPAIAFLIDPSAPRAPPIA